MFVELTNPANPSKTKFTVGNFYRPPHATVAIASKNIYEKLNKDIHCNPNENYNILESEIIKSMESHMNKKTVKFNRRKHKRDPWITFGILRSVNKNKKIV